MQSKALKKLRAELSRCSLAGDARVSDSDENRRAEDLRRECLADELRLREAPHRRRASTGVGEATLEWKTKTIVGALEDLERFIVGKDPFQVEHLIETMHRDSYWRTGAVFRSALGAMEAALLDIKGKALGVPVYELLGGKHRDRLKCYANHWFQGAVTPDDYAKKAPRRGQDGFSRAEMGPVRQRLSGDGPKGAARDDRDRRGGARRRRPRRRADARRARTAERADRDRHVPRARALRPDLDRGADAAGIDRRARRRARQKPGADRGRRAPLRAGALRSS